MQSYLINTRRDLCQQFIEFHDPFLQSCVINSELKRLPIQINFLKCSRELGKTEKVYTDKVVRLDFRLMKANLILEYVIYIFREKFTLHL